MSDTVLLLTVFMFQVSSPSLAFSLSPPAHNASAMADIILIKSGKSSLNLLEHYNYINYRTTADSQHVDVHVALLRKIKYNFSVSLTRSLIISFSGRSNISGVIFITAEMYTILHISSCV